MIQRERFEELAFILQTPFLIERKNRGDILQSTFSEFHSYVRSLNEYRNKKLQLNRVSVTADLIKQRAGEKYNFELLKDTDVFLYYISLLFPNNKVYYRRHWFPETSCYRNWNMRILPKMVLERYFNRVKVLFGVKDKAELLIKIDEIIKDRSFIINDFNYMVPDIKQGLAVEEMCTIK